MSQLVLESRQETNYDLYKTKAKEAVGHRRAQSQLQIEKLARGKKKWNPLASRNSSLADISPMKLPPVENPFPSAKTKVESSSLTRANDTARILNLKSVIDSIKKGKLLEN